MEGRTVRNSQSTMKRKEGKKMSVLDSCDNSYTMESADGFWCCEIRYTHLNTCTVFALTITERRKKKEKVIPPGIEPGTLSVLDSCDNRYTMESTGGSCGCEIRYIYSFQ